MEVIKGRMYDYNNGRFLSVDPFISGFDSQSLNPYTYLRNNPLSGTDPSGYVECDENGENCKIKDDEIEKVLKDDDGNLYAVVNDEEDNSKQQYYKIDTVTATSNGISYTYNFSNGSTNISDTEGRNGITLKNVDGGYTVQLLGVGKGGENLGKSEATLFIPYVDASLKGVQCLINNNCPTMAEMITSIGFSIAGNAGLKFATPYLSKLPGFKWLAKSNACCFVAGTQVLTKDGYKNIEDVKLGELVWAKDVETGQSDWKPVSKIYVEHDRGIYHIRLRKSDGDIINIEATDDHPFYVVDHGWKTTVELQIGDNIETKEVGSVVVVSVEDEHREDTTYNFEIADFHTYYVTEFGVLVHNGVNCIKSVFESKISKQMNKRGWNEVKVNDTINNPTKTVRTTDTRWNSDGTRRSDSATAYIDKDGSYVVRNDKDGTIIQVSDRNDPDWKSPF